jgi:hypothetical protein
LTVNVVSTLSFATIAPQTYGNAPFTVNAPSASSGVVTYTVASGPATIAGSTVTLTGTGTVVLSEPDIQWQLLLPRRRRPPVSQLLRRCRH